MSSSAKGPGDTKSLARRPDFALGDATVRPSLRKLDGPLGSVTGEPRVIQVLVALADARGGVLSRDDLLRLCWDGRIVGDDAINRAVAEVRRIAAEVGARFEVETVPRVGYRIAGIDWESEPAPVAAWVSAIGRRKLLAGGAAAIALVAGGGAAILYRRRHAEVDALIEHGRLRRGLGDREGRKQAEVLFRQAIARDPNRADAWGWLATVRDDMTQSRDDAMRALELDPREPNARTILASLRRDLDAWTQWEDALLEVLEDAPECAPALNHLTFFYQGMGRCRDSLALNERSSRAEPFNLTNIHRRALKLWIFGRVSEADRTADRGLELWPRNANMWNARMLIYAGTGRAEAALALLDDLPSRPANLKPPSVDSWRAALIAIKSRSPADIARAVETFRLVAALAPGLAANAIMMSSHLGEFDAAYRFAEGLLVNRGQSVQRARGKGIEDVYSDSAWGRTQFLFIPITSPFRADPRFPELCQRMGHVDYWRRRGIWPDPFVRGALDPAKLA